MRQWLQSRSLVTRLLNEVNWHCKSFLKISFLRGWKRKKAPLSLCRKKRKKISLLEVTKTGSGKTTGQSGKSPRSSQNTIWKMNVKRYVRKGCQKRNSEDISERTSEKVPKICQERMSDFFSPRACSFKPGHQRKKTCEK